MLYDSTYTRDPEEANSWRQEVEQRLPGELCFNEYRASVWDNGKIIEMNSGDGCATV